MQPDYEIGQVVFSKAGRDKGKALIVYDIIDEDYFYVVNGKNHTTDKPKRKNIKHLQKTVRVSQLIANKVKAGEEVFNGEIQCELKKLASTDAG